MPRSADRTRKAHAIAAGAFDAERLDPPVGLGPREEGLIATCIGGERLVTQMDPTGVDRHRTWMCLWVSTPTIAPRTSGRGVRLLVTGGLLGCGRCLDQLDGQDCDGPWGAGPYRVTGQPIG